MNRFLLSRGKIEIPCWAFVQARAPASRRRLELSHFQLQLLCRSIKAGLPKLDYLEFCSFLCLFKVNHSNYCNLLDGKFRLVLKFCFRSVKIESIFKLSLFIRQLLCSGSCSSCEGVLRLELQQMRWFQNISMANKIKARFGV